jgi:hypothetical protein
MKSGHARRRSEIGTSHRKRKFPAAKERHAHQWLTTNNLAGPVEPYRESLSQVANGAVRGNHASESFAILI